MTNKMPMWSIVAFLSTAVYLAADASGGIKRYVNMGGSTSSTTIVESGDFTALATFGDYGVWAVPEPVSLSLLAVGAVALIRRRRK